MANTLPETATVQTLSLVSSYVPRKCGIATFAKDLRDAMAAELGEVQCPVVAMDDVPEGYDYPAEVRFQVPSHGLAAYRTAAELLNINQIDAVAVQHEFGLYGGRDGTFILELMRRLRMPIITTLHTILREPSPGQRAVMHDLIQLSAHVVTMSRLGEQILLDVYQAPPEKVAFVPHGIPDLPFVDPNFYKDQYNVEGRTVMMTFGLLSPGKGIDVAINALPRIVEKHPDVVYVVLGATHPHLYKREGNAYLHSLERLVRKLGVSEHVVFHNRFVTLEELRGYLGAADVYVTPYPNKEQIASGTLCYALGAGKAVVSTPYWHAEEMLAEGRGRLFPFNDAEALAAEVIELLENEVECHAMRKRAYLYCRPMVWKEVGRQYLQLTGKGVGEQKLRPQPIKVFQVDRSPTGGLPDLDLLHLRRLTDDTGILQHAAYAIPDRRHGYCTDDNARALVAALMCYDLQHDPSVLELADIYMAFIHHAFNCDSRRFRNFMSYDRQWLEEAGSEDVHGRALWALGSATAPAPNEAVRSFATRLFQDAVATAEQLISPRAWAFSLVGIHAYLQKFDGDTQTRRVRRSLADMLLARFLENASDDWPWCEDVVTYGNAKLPHALILAGQWVPHAAMLKQGLRSLRWLMDLQVDPDGHVSLIGNHGWIRRGGRRARFDQQPIEVMALIEACAEAYRATQDESWIDRAWQCLGWFTGNNDTESHLYDYHTGGCRDGLHPHGPNLNQGAESTLAWLISLMTLMGLNRLQGGTPAEASAAREEADAPVEPVTD